jgi:hypothetical protein
MSEIGQAEPYGANKGARLREALFTPVTCKRGCLVLLFPVQIPRKHMTKSVVRNALFVVGVWAAWNLLASLLGLLIVLIKPSMTFEGDVGNALLWIWQALPRIAAAGVAAVVLLWVGEARNALSRLFALAALCLYSGGLNGWRQIMHGWRVPPRTSDYVGIFVSALLPTVSCIIVGICWTKYRRPNQIEPNAPAAA